MGAQVLKTALPHPQEHSIYQMAELAYDAHFKDGKKVTTVKDVQAEKFIVAFAQHLKRQGRFEIPKWSDYVKTAKYRELPPLDPDWLYTRAASMVRKIYIRRGIGVQAFRKIYGNKQRGGARRKWWPYHRQGGPA